MRDRSKCGTGSMKVVAGVMGICAMFFLVLLCPIAAYAHPPKEVKIVYTITSQKLDVSVTHDTSFTGFHYINKIEIKKNGESAGVHKYQSQPTKSEFTYTYDVPAVQGDVLEVTATCSLSGSKTVKVTVGTQEK
jgi:hypothetical protein